MLNHSEPEKNLTFSSSEIAKFYLGHRQRWSEFYESERVIFDWVAQERSGTFGSVLDVGCAAGGLGHALRERFDLASYQGVDINAEAIAAAQKSGSRSEGFSFIAGDILDLELDRHQFDTVTALSCADWNIETDRIIQRCWDYVAPGGYLVISFRLTNLDGINDFARSYQLVSFDDPAPSESMERANYVVFNTTDLIRRLCALEHRPSLIRAYGYWGKPSPSARTPFQEIGFGVFALRKESRMDLEPNLSLELPASLLLG